MFDIEIKRIDRNKKLVFKMGTNSQMMLSIYYFFNGQWVKNNNDFHINTNEFWKLYEKIVNLSGTTTVSVFPQYSEQSDIYTTTFTLGCATGTTYTSLLNYTMLSSLSSSIDLGIVTATLNLTSDPNATTTATTTEELGPDPKTDISGVVTLVAKCTETPSDMSLSVVEIRPCEAGDSTAERYEPDAAGNMIYTGSGNENIYVTYRDNMHEDPKVGDVILARVVPDGAGTCSEIEGTVQMSGYDYEGVISSNYGHAPAENGECGVTAPSDDDDDCGWWHDLTGSCDGGPW